MSTSARESSVAASTTSTLEDDCLGSSPPSSGSSRHSHAADGPKASRKDLESSFTVWRPGLEHPVPFSIYSPSGFDIMGFLVQVKTRPNPRVELGPVDCSCPLIVCDLQQPDRPIVYCSDAFAMLTLYHPSEVLGRNCRFLQSPRGDVLRGSHRDGVDRSTVEKLHEAVEQNVEVQVEIVNFKKGGQRFLNVLTVIPIRWRSSKYNYSIGFQSEKEMAQNLHTA
ncbi:hypothetical protein VTK73DRAFT_8736 [Phialemonium thermophilum]|uniref:PAS domain-containing protein n=1 Tax=Phialemonium thermophilum TaxID=223376 RepID=A0ABR3W6V9_9PEZI